MCQVGILFSFCYLALVTPISGSVINLHYPFNDFTIHSVHQRVSVNNLQSFCWQENSVFSKDLPRLLWMFPFSLPQCQRTPLLFLCWKGSVPLACALGIWILLLFVWLRAEVFSWKTLWQEQFEFSVLRNLCRNIECRCLKHWQGLGLCHCIPGHQAILHEWQCLPSFGVIPCNQTCTPCSSGQATPLCTPAARAVSLFPLLLHRRSCHLV